MEADCSGRFIFARRSRFFLKFLADSVTLPAFSRHSLESDSARTIPRAQLIFAVD
jgi:hypothetical protein